MPWWEAAASGCRGGAPPKRKKEEGEPAEVKIDDPARHAGVLQGRPLPQGGANVFVAHSRFQGLIADHMVRSMSEFAGVDNHLVLDMPRAGVRSGGASWKEIVLLHPPTGDGILGRARRRRRSLETVGALLSRYRDARLFLPDIHRPLNNALYGLARKRKGGTIELCHFPDGLVNLIPVYPDILQSLKVMARALVGAVGGPPYHYYQGDLMGLSLSDRIYSLMPAKAGHGGQSVVEVPKIRPRLLDRNPHGCLFLGQDFDRIVSRKAFRNLCEGAARFSVDLGYPDLAYKPHPRETFGIGEEVFRRHGFEILRDPRPVEEIFFTRQVACVASFDSESLAHLKLLFGDDVRCVACFTTETPRHREVEERTGLRRLDLLLLCGVEPYA